MKKLMGLGNVTEEVKSDFPRQRMSGNGQMVRIKNKKPHRMPLASMYPKADEVMEILDRFHAGLKK